MRNLSTYQLLYNALPLITLDYGFNEQKEYFDTMVVQHPLPLVYADIMDDIMLNYGW